MNELINTESGKHTVGDELIVNGKRREEGEHIIVSSADNDEVFSDTRGSCAERERVSG